MQHFPLLLTFLPVVFSLNIWSFNPKENSLWSKAVIEARTTCREVYFLSMANLLTEQSDVCSKLQNFNNLGKSFIDDYYFSLVNELHGCNVIQSDNLPSLDLDELSLAELAAAIILHERMDDLGRWVKKATTYFVGKSNFHDESSSDLALILGALIHYKRNSITNSLRETVFTVRFAIIEAHPNLFTYLISLFPDNFSASATVVTTAAESLQYLKLSLDVQVMFESIESLKAVLSLSNAVQVELFPHKSKAGENLVLTLRAVDVYGKPVDITSGTLISLRKAGKDGVVVEDIEFEGSSVALQDLSLQGGRYFAVFQVHFPTAHAATKFQAAFLVDDAVSVKSIRWSVSSSVNSESVDWETTTSATPRRISANVDNHLHVAVSLKPTLARRYHQMQLKFCSVSNVACAVLNPTTCKESDELLCFFRVGFSEQSEKFISGEFSAAVIIGDVSLSEAVEFSVVNLLINFPETPVSPYPLYRKALLYDSDSTLHALPEIVHQMRPPAKRAPNSLSYGFSALIVVPLLVYIYSILYLRPRLQLYLSLSSLTSTLLFASLMIVYGLYWLGFEGMSFYTTIKYLCIIFPILMVTARQTISNMMKQRLQSK